MRKYLAVTTVLLLALAGCFISSLSYAQEDEEAAVVVEETEYSYGIVSSVSANQIVVKEINYDTDEETDVTYSIDPAVKLEGVESLTDIAAGDMVDIDYVVKDDKKIAKIISVEKEMPVEESVEEDVEATPAEEEAY
jgi:hypothetical protein